MVTIVLICLNQNWNLLYSLWIHLLCLKLYNDLTTLFIQNLEIFILQIHLISVLCYNLSVYSLLFFYLITFLFFGDIVCVLLIILFNKFSYLYLTLLFLLTGVSIQHHSPPPFRVAKFFIFIIICYDGYREYNYARDLNSFNNQTLLI